MNRKSIDFDFFIKKFNIENKIIAFNFNGVFNASWREAVFYHAYADPLAFIIIEPILVDNLINEIGEILAGNNHEVDLTTFFVLEKICSSDGLPSLEQMREQKDLLLRIYQELQKCN